MQITDMISQGFIVVWALYCILLCRLYDVRSPFDDWSRLRTIEIVYNDVGLRLDDWECLTLTHLVRIVVDVEVNMVTRFLMMGIYPEVLTGSLMEVC